MNPALRRATTAMVPFEPAAGTAYPIELVACLTRLPRHAIAVYWRRGLVSTIGAPADDGWAFERRAIRTLQCLEWLRASGVNPPGVQMIWQLLCEIDGGKDPEAAAAAGAGFPSAARTRKGGLWN